MIEPADQEADESSNPTDRAARQLELAMGGCIVVVARGPDRGKRLELRSGSYLVGKGRSCALVLRDAEVSRRHLELRVEPWGIIVNDLGSTNGTYVAGVRVREVVVSPGINIVLGQSELRLWPKQEATLAEGSVQFGRMLGRSAEMRRLFAVLERIAASSAPLLIEGETGTGKELCAEAVHLSSPRRARPFVVCDLAGVPRSLIESELFGHRKGAFTGATSDRPGALASADTGTLFLDELAELEIDLQPRLLRAIEAKAFKPIGGNDYTRVDVRFIAATNRDLAFEVRSGRFRGDLYHRLAVMHVRIPPLRERKEDIPDLCTQLLAGTGSVVAPRALDVLTAYDWPGNVRELRNVLERAVALAPPGRSVEPEALGLALTSTAAKDSAHYHAARRLLLDNWERAYVTQVIEMAGGNLSLAARRCGLGRAHLRRLLNKHDVR